MENLCKEKDFIGWFPTSAKEDKNIETACRFLIEKILENDKRLTDKRMAMSTNSSGNLNRPGRRNNRLVDLSASDNNKTPVSSSCCS